MGVQILKRWITTATLPCCMLLPRDNLAVVQWLLKEGGACIKEMDNNGSTALMKAADNWHLVVVQWLLMEGGEYVSDELWRRLRPNNPAVLFEDTHTHQEPSYYLSM